MFWFWEKIENRVGKTPRKFIERSGFANVLIIMKNE